MTDIRKFSVEETGTIHLRDGADELMYADKEQKNPMRIVVYGPGSKAFARAEAKLTSRAMERARGKGKPRTEDAQKAKVDFLSECTKDFENISYGELKGDALFKGVYADTTLGFVADQVNQYLADWGNFTKSAN